MTAETDAPEPADLLRALYDETIARDALFAGHDVLMKRLGIEKVAFSRLRAALDREGFLDRGVVGMDRLSSFGIRHVEERL